MEITAMALAWLHSYIFENIVRHINKESKILILWSWKWSFENILIKNWFNNIYSCDYYTENLLADKINFYKLDFNNPEFSTELISKSWGEFDLVISIEIIEHLHSPYKFLENIRYLLKDNWFALISTPNMHSYLSRIDYILTWYPTLFITKPWIWDHISPIFDNVLLHFCELNNLEITNKYWFWSIWNYIKEYKIEWIRSYIYLWLISILYFILNPLMLLNRKDNSKIVSIFKISKN